MLITSLGLDCRNVNDAMSDELLLKHSLNSTSKAKFAGELSETFPIKVGVHQRSALSPLLFNVVMEETTKSCRVGDPWELLYADDLILTA